MTKDNSSSPNQIIQQVEKVPSIYFISQITLQTGKFTPFDFETQDITTGSISGSRDPVTCHHHPFFSPINPADKRVYTIQFPNSLCKFPFMRKPSIPVKPQHSFRGKQNKELPFFYNEPNGILGRQVYLSVLTEENILEKEKHIQPSHVIPVVKRI